MEPEALPDVVWRIMSVAPVEVRLPDQYPVVTLLDTEVPGRSISFRIGLPEGAALRHAQDGTSAARPLSGDLLAEVVAQLGAQLAAVRLTGRLGSVYLAELEFMTPAGRRTVPCRPSDGITLALRREVKAPVLADERLFSDGDV